MDLASVEGLDGLSIGRLATELGVSKSGLFAHFGSKESLQLATVAAAVDRYVQLRAFLEAANQQSVLHDDDSGYDRARAAIRVRLESLPARAPG